GTGIGPGTGSGLGLGSGGNTGGGPYRPGSGVSAAIALNVIKPQYPSQAMRARVQGVVQVESAGRPTGVCPALQVLRPPARAFDASIVRGAFVTKVKWGRPSR